MSEALTQGHTVLLCAPIFFPCLIAQSKGSLASLHLEILQPALFVRNLILPPSQGPGLPSGLTFLLMEKPWGRLFPMTRCCLHRVHGVTCRRRD